MANYIPNGGELLCLDSIVAGELTGATLHLFNANHTPVQGDLAADYNAIEATFGGYAAITLNAWSAVFTNAANEAESDEIVRTFLATGAGLPEDIWGVYVLDGPGDLVYVELFPTGKVTLSAAGQTLSYLPVFTLRTQP